MTRPLYKTLLGALALLAVCVAPVSAKEYIPMYNFSLQGGQYFFTGSKTNLNANMAANVTPAVKLDNGWTLLPIYNGIYRGTKGVNDSVGAGTLFQQMMSHRVSISGLRQVQDWKLKPSFSYKHEFLKETVDESWTKGLFDYQKIGVGVEGEKVYKDPFSVRMGYDFYYIRFPNFQSLESKSGFDPSGNALGRETAGTRVLDTFNNQFTVAATRPYPYNDPKVSLQASYSFLMQMFADQPIINSAGQPQSGNRMDFNQSLNLSVMHPRELKGGDYRLNSGFQFGFTHNGSNQNTYDAGQTRFIFDTYSYTSISMGPSVGLSWDDPKKPATAGASFLYSRTQYNGRLTQNPSGVYQGDSQTQSRYLLSLGYGYPIAPNFRLTAQTNFLWADSNMNYEKTYKYTYNAATYLLGFVYDY
ncbi:MAG: hypothetical protein AAB576_01595 [Elusimicrobiota bacterium]